MGFESVKYGSGSFDGGLDAVRGWFEKPSREGSDTV